MPDLLPDPFPCCHPPPMDCPSLVSDRLRDAPGAAGRMQTRFGQRVKGIVRKKLGHAHKDAWDGVSQDAWIRIDAGLHRWNGQARFCSYLATITAHAAIDYLRKVARRPPVSDGYDFDVADGNLGPDEHLIRKEEAANLLAWIERYRKTLPERELLAWTLLEKGLTRKDVASELAVSVRSIDGYVSKFADSIAWRLKVKENGLKLLRRLIPDMVRILRGYLTDD